MGKQKAKKVFDLSGYTGGGEKPKEPSKKVFDLSGYTNQGGQEQEPVKPPSKQSSPSLDLSQYGTQKIAPIVQDRVTRKINEDMFKFVTPSDVTDRPLNQTVTHQRIQEVEGNRKAKDVYNPRNVFNINQFKKSDPEFNKSHSMVYGLGSINQKYVKGQVKEANEERKNIINFIEDEYKLEGSEAIEFVETMLSVDEEVGGYSIGKMDTDEKGTAFVNNKLISRLGFIDPNQWDLDEKIASFKERPRGIKEILMGLSDGFQDVRSGLDAAGTEIIRSITWGDVEQFFIDEHKEFKEDKEERKYDRNEFTNNFARNLGSAIPSFIPIATGVGISAYGNPVAGARIGQIGFATLTASSGGNYLDSYKEYKAGQGLDVDPLEMYSGMVGTMAVEYLTERMGFGGKMVRNGNLLRKSGIKLAPGKAEAIGEDVLKLFKSTNPNKYKQLMKEMASSFNKEGGSEALATFGQSAIENAYKELKDKSSEGEILKQMWESYKIGGLMAGAVGPLSFKAHNNFHKERRNQQGGILIADFKGEAVEVIRRKKSKSDGVEVMQYEVIDSMGDTQVVNAEDAGKVYKVTNEQFDNLLNGKVDESSALENSRIESVKQAQINIDQSVEEDLADVSFENGQGEKMVVFAKLGGVEVFVTSQLEEDPNIWIISTKNPDGTNTQTTVHKKRLTDVSSPVRVEQIKESHKMQAGVNYIPEGDNLKPPQLGEVVNDPNIGPLTVIGYNESTGDVNLRVEEEILDEEGKPLPNSDTIHLSRQQFDELKQLQSQEIDTPVPEVVETTVEDKDSEEQLFDKEGNINLNNIENEEATTKSDEATKAGENQSEKVNDVDAKSDERVSGDDRTSPDRQGLGSSSNPKPKLNPIDDSRNTPSSDQDRQGNGSSELLQQGEHQAGSEVRVEQEESLNETPNNQSSKPDKGSEEVLESVPKKKSKSRRPSRKANKGESVSEKLQKVTPTTTRQAIQQFFATKGRIGTESFKKETGFGSKSTKDGASRNKKEFDRRLWMVKNNGISIDELTMSIKDRMKTDSTNVELDDQDIRNEIIDVLTGYDSIGVLQRELVDDFSVNNELVLDSDERIFLKQQKEFEDHYANSMPTEAQEAVTQQDYDQVMDMSEHEAQAILDDEKEFNKLISLQDDQGTNTKNEATQQDSSNEDTAEEGSAVEDPPFQRAVRTREVEQAIQDSLDQLPVLKGTDATNATSKLFNPENNGENQKRVLKEVTSILSDWKNAPEVVVFESVLDFSVAKPSDSIRASRGAGGVNGVSAYFDANSNTIYYIASHSKFREGKRFQKEALETTLHELIGHYGLRGSVNALVGQEGVNELYSLLDRLAPNMNTKQLDKLARTYTGNPKAKFKNLEKGSEQYYEALEEYIAFSVQEEAWDTPTKRAVKWFKELLETKFNVKFSDTELRNVISNAKKFVSVGDSPFMVERPSVMGGRNQLPLNYQRSQKSIKFEDYANTRGNQEVREGGLQKEARDTFKSAHTYIARGIGSVEANEQIALQHKNAKEYAEKNGLLIKSLEDLGTPTDDGGMENRIAINPEKEEIYKSNNLLVSKGNILDHINYIQRHNHLFPETAYELVGFQEITKNKELWMKPVVKQKLISDARKATQEEIDSEMKSRGYYSNDRKSFSYENGVFEISDLKPANVLFRDGELFVIDDINKKFSAEDVRFQIIGAKGSSNLKGKSFFDANRKLAEELEKDSFESPLTIRLATGLERGKDGQWRNEIGDSPFMVERPSVMGVRNQLPLNFQRSQKPITFEDYANTRGNQEVREGKLQKEARDTFKSAHTYIARGIGSVEANEQIALQHKNAKEHAEKNGLLIKSLEDLGTPTDDGGMENRIAINPEKGEIYKSNNLLVSKGNILDHINYIQRHNHLFPETAYELVGFQEITKNKELWMKPVVKQKLISDARKATQEEIDSYMKSRGYYSNDRKSFSYENTVFEISDLKPANVLFKEGKIFVIDDINKKFSAEDVRFQIIGAKGSSNLKGKSFFDANRKLAEELEKDSFESPLTIRLATGLERGKDGQWRNEIGDSPFMVERPSVMGVRNQLPVNYQRSQKSIKFEDYANTRGNQEVRGGSLQKERRDTFENAYRNIGRGVSSVGADQQVELQHKNAKEYAKANGLWIDDLSDLGTVTDFGGMENRIAINSEKGEVYKSNNLLVSKGDILSHINYIQRHNHLFQNAPYDLVGFQEVMKDKKPWIKPIVKQKFITGEGVRKATPEEIDAYMKSRGYYSNDRKSFSYENGVFEISDLKPANVLFRDGELFVIDDINKKFSVEDTRFQRDLFGNTEQSNNEELPATRRIELNQKLKTATKRLAHLRKLPISAKSNLVKEEIDALQKDVIRVNDQLANTLREDQARAGGEQQSMFQISGTSYKDKRSVPQDVQLPSVQKEAPEPFGTKMTPEQFKVALTTFETKRKFLNAINGMGRYQKTITLENGDKVRISDKKAFTNYIDKFVDQPEFKSKHGNRLPQNYDYLLWEEAVTQKQSKRIKEVVGENTFDPETLQQFSGAELYGHLERVYGTKKLASEALLRAKIDGTKTKEGLVVFGESDRDEGQFNSETNDLRFQIPDNGENINFEGNENQEESVPKGKHQESVRKPFQAAFNAIRGGIETTGTQQQRLDSEKQAAYKYAKDNNLWKGSLYDIGEAFKGGGVENTLAYDPDQGIIYKANNLILNEQSILKYINAIQGHNALFPETHYDFVGFTGFGDRKIPYVEPIVKQKYIADARQATIEEIDAYMVGAGFVKTDEFTYEKGDSIVSDVRPRNVLVTNDGSVYVIDPVVDLGSGESQNSDEPTTLFQRPGIDYNNESDNFYSNSLKALNYINQPKGTGEQWKAMLLKNGASQAELNWIGFDEFIKDNPKPTKEEVSEFISSNQVDLHERGDDRLTFAKGDNVLADVKAVVEEGTLVISDAHGELDKRVSNRVVRYASEAGLNEVIFPDDIENVEITPSIRETAISEGMPMFQRQVLAEEDGATTLSRLGRTRAKHQDSMLMLKKLQDKATDSKYGFVDDASDAYSESTLYQGKIKDQYHRVFQNDYMNPLKKQLLKVQKDHGVEYDEIGEYLRAKHIVEDNIEKGGIPMPIAQEMVKAFESKIPAKEAKAMNDQIRMMTHWDLQQKAEYGLISQKQFKDIASMYSHYVPLKGWESVTLDDETNFSLLKERKGRTTPDYVEYEQWYLQQDPDRVKGQSKEDNMKLYLADMKANMSSDPIAYIDVQTHSTIIQGEKNLFKQSFLRFVEHNPDTRMYSLQHAWYVQNEDGSWRVQYNHPGKEAVRQGLARHTPPDTDGMTQEELMKLYANIKLGGRDNELMVLRDGRPVIIELASKDLAQAFKKQPVGDDNALMRTYTDVYNYLRAVRTQYSPEFGIVNYLRDASFGVKNLYVDKGFRVASEVLNDVTLKNVYSRDSSFRVLWRAIWGNDFTGDGMLFREYLENGASTGWADMKEVRRIYSTVKSEVNGTKDRNLWRTALNIINKYNEVVENTVRFAAYRSLRNRGISAKQAAIYAKDLTVNFNRKGSSPYLNKAFMFFNAGVQGTERSLRPYAGKEKGQRGRLAASVAGLMAAQAAAATLSRLLGGEDEDGVFYYDKLPEYTRSMNWVLPNLFSEQEGDFLRIPKPYGDNFYTVVADHMLRSAMEVETPRQATGAIVSGMLNAFVPVDIATSEDNMTALGGVFKTITPTVLKPQFELMMNRNFAGSMIYPEKYSGQEGKPNSQMYFRSVNPIAKEASQLLNKITGGSEVEAGLVDISPESIEHYFSTYTGGVGKFLSNGYNFTNKLVTKGAEEAFDVESGNANKIPFARKFISSNPSFYYDQEKYYQNKEKLSILEKQVKEYQKLIDTGRDDLKPMRNDLIKRNPEFLDYNDNFTTNVKAKDFKKEEDEVRDRRDDMILAKDKSISEYNKAREELMKQYRKSSRYLSKPKSK